MDKIKPQIGPPEKNEVLIKDGDGGQWLYFRQPHQIILATTLEEVLPALQEVESVIQRNGWHAAGFLSYEAASAFDPALRTRPKTEFPLLWFGLYPEPSPVALARPIHARKELNWQSTIDRPTYDAAIKSIKNRIAEGLTYQVNYTMRLQTDFTGEPWEFFLSLVRNQDRHAAYLDIGQFVICSASPELFFQLDNQRITCRPMKGTASRGRTPAEDREQSSWLRDSAKNRAENVMIVDMIRNDLGRIAELGSVCVPEIFKTERYSTLWQMTSTVEAKTRAPLTQILKALFPCASITGAPKVSTMNLIAELERTPRGIYTGAIGYISPKRKAKFSVAIRTAAINREQNTAEYGVGGGIVWDSTSADEYAEALLKAQALTQPTHPFCILETILWTPEEGFVLGQKHIQRMIDSANYFDFPIEEAKLRDYLEEISTVFQTPQRVRVLLDQSGSLNSQCEPFERARDDNILNVCLAKHPLDTNDVFLFHKTTRREAYENAKEGLEGFDDVLLYNEAGELTEFTIGNLVLEQGGQFFTPPIYCGVLPGTFRAHLIETGRVVERTIPAQQLTHYGKIFRVNSIRGWQEVKLQPGGR